MKHNIMESLMCREDNCHGGEGHIQVFRAFDRSVDSSKVDFIDFVEVPDQASIGRHRHGDNREWYVILKGQGQMLFQEQQIYIYFEYLYVFLL